MTAITSVLTLTQRLYYSPEQLLRIGEIFYCRFKYNFTGKQPITFIVINHLSYVLVFVLHFASLLDACATCRIGAGTDANEEKRTGHLSCEGKMPETGNVLRLCTHNS